MIGVLPLAGKLAGSGYKTESFWDSALIGPLNKPAQDSQIRVSFRSNIREHAAQFKLYRAYYISFTSSTVEKCFWS